MKPNPQLVAKGNPCPFLRAMQAYQLLKSRAEGLVLLSKKVSQLGGKSKPEGKLGKGMIFFIAWIANGFGLLRLSKSLSAGLDIEDLRAGPLYKKGVSSRIINSDGTINAEELDRFASYAADVTDPSTGQKEKGLKLEHLNKFMDDNFSRASENRRAIDRRLMDGEWPVLLAVMGKDQGKERYLSVNEVRTLFLENQFPERIEKRIAAS